MRKFNFSIPNVGQWDPFPCTPVGQSNGTALTNTSTTALYRIVGDTIECQIYSSFGGTPGGGTGYFLWNLPKVQGGVNSNKMLSTVVNTNCMGQAIILDSGTNTRLGTVGYSAASDAVVVNVESGATAMSVTVPIGLVGGDSVYLHFQLPWKGLRPNRRGR
jgi:hypothetical protein